MVASFFPSNIIKKDIKQKIAFRHKNDIFTVTQIGQILTDEICSKSGKTHEKISRATDFKLEQIS
ncbi:hypothetical protein AGMMS49990_03170 [Endomicrobiia bacterium]|nr:hypothetical protein AGMMS49990_03170 [Endomicrobiia bacterium]